MLSTHVEVFRQAGKQRTAPHSVNETNLCRLRCHNGAWATLWTHGMKPRATAPRLS